MHSPHAVTREIAAEAAVWVARLHGPDRSPRMECEFLSWQARSAAHRTAFERCTDTWLDVARLSLSTYANAVSARVPASGEQRAARLNRRAWAFGATAALVVGSVLVLQPWRDADADADAYVTGVGEQRLVVLQDDTRLSLNTATRVRVDLGAAQRTVHVEEGEAYFEVAKDARRPFVVKVAGAEVVATGTAFVVQFVPRSKAASDSLAVTLVEGQVIVRDAAAGAGDASLPLPVVMSAGERMRLHPPGGAAKPTATQVDRPRMEQVLAWKRGEALFDDVSLLDAVAEMNRCSATPIRVADAGARVGLRVSGVFRTGDNTGFARAMAALHGLVVRELPDRLELVPH